jgi:DNA-binding transcriptional MocR family regulator
VPKFHRNSGFGPGPRRPLDRNERARFKFLVRAHARAGTLPAKQEWIANALLKRLGEDGQCDPSYATLAADAGCSESTAERACAKLKDLGLLRWTQRLIRNGWRAEQTSNAYELVPTAELPVPACDRQTAGVTHKQAFSSLRRVVQGLRAPTDGDDEWGRQNARRQLELLAAA